MRLRQPVILNLIIILILGLVLSCGGNGKDPVKPAVPDRLTTPHSIYFVGNLGSSTFALDPDVVLTDGSGNLYSGKWIKMAVMSGYGTLSSDSILTDSNGKITLGFTFDNIYGYAIVRVWHSTLDPVDLFFRASALNVNPIGQGDLALLTDTREEAIGFYGNPGSTSSDFFHWITKVSFTSPGYLQVWFEDLNQDGLASAGEEVIGIRLSAGFTGTTEESIGIGSTIDEIRAAYGTPDTVATDFYFLSRVYVKYNSRSLAFVCDSDADTTALEIILVEDFASIAEKLPTAVVAVNGNSYKGVMGDVTIDEPLTFKLTDAQSRAYPSRWIQFTLLEGDGTLSADSAITNSGGEATIQYGFTGEHGYARIMGSFSGATSSEASIRASLIKPGVDGQGQYIRFSDDYGIVRAFNGQPASVDVDPYQWLTYANYESALGVVVILYDTDSSETASDDEGVYGVILNTVYTGKTADSIGIGSTIADFRAVYGDADSVRIDPTPPAAIYIRYNSLGLDCYSLLDSLATYPDTVIHEIHITDISSPISPILNSQSIRKPSRSSEPSAARGYRRSRF